MPVVYQYGQTVTVSTWMIDNLFTNVSTSTTTVLGANVVLIVNATERGRACSSHDCEGQRSAASTPGEAAPFVSADEARERARALMLALLSPQNREHFERHGEVLITGSAGGRYRIGHGHSGNVVQLSTVERESTRVVLCAHPPMYIPGRGEIPVEDAMIAQMLMILTDEPRFLQIANQV